MSRSLSVLAIVSQVVFVLTWLVAPLWQGPEYSVIAHSISDMYADTAPGGLVLVVVFTLCGAATVAFAIFALRPALGAAGWAAWVGSLLLAASIFGLGDLLTPFERLACRIADAGCSPADQVATAGGALDSTLSSIGVALLVVAGFFLAAAMAHTPGWTAAVWPTRVVSIALVALLILSGVGSGIGGGAGIGGLLERGIALIGAAGIAAVAGSIIRRQIASASDVNAVAAGD